ncbi:hypothetical protein QRX50_35240 [Amycolatopsis carbonis]|uniref:Uncharacterized protein n=1 Tax=Amycolatopsis carbonis TaxID=715471 RepID=A0A9Y2IS42_9PSEU|nr:hypothetical protein [Amycolatopsis sp. 2-15]WIX84255.1 hypothetical protein QRX50_35240 [Amycolatopsis sp. 2-15]
MAGDLRRARALSRTDADVVLIDGVRSAEAITEIRRIIGDKPLLFNQIAGGKSPGLSLPELSALEVDLAIYSTPCLFAAQEGMDNALIRLRHADGRLPELNIDRVGVTPPLGLLEHNISRHHGTPVRAGR